MPHEIVGPGSLDRRPDAISSDYSFAYTFGPVQLSDFSLGLLNRAWRVRADAGSVLLSRANDANDAWEPEVELFAYDPASPVIEIDAAFDQQGRVFVCTERASGVDGASELWFYYFNGLVGDYTFENFGPGRTPRAILDSPTDPAIADVLVFYMDDANDRISYRQQRDRYQTVYATPVTGSADKYLEDAVRSESYRIYVYYSLRDQVAGRYVIEHIESLLYPVLLSLEDLMTASTEFGQEGDIHEALLFSTLFDPESQTASADFGPPGELHETLITFVLFEHDDQTASAAFGPGGTLIVTGPTTINSTIFDPESQTASASFGAGNTIRVSLISSTIYDPDTMTASATFGAGGTLV